MMYATMGRLYHTLSPTSPKGEWLLISNYVASHWGLGTECNLKNYRVLQGFLSREEVETVLRLAPSSMFRINGSVIPARAIKAEQLNYGWVGHNTHRSAFLHILFNCKESLELYTALKVMGVKEYEALEITLEEET